MKITRKPTLFALSGYFLLSLLLTWPTITRLTSAIPGDGFDGWQNYWNQWWIKEALLVRQTHFFFTDLLYPPTGTSLLFHTLNFFNGLWTLPLQLNFGLAVAYNAVVFFHFTLAGFGVYLLARYVLARLGLGVGWGAWAAAFTAGVIFTWSPFHLAHLLGHMQVFSLTWPPFYALWLLRTVERWRVGQAGLPRRDLALSGLFLALTTMVDWYQTLYLLLFTVLILLWAIWGAWRGGTRRPQELLKPILGLAGMGLIVGLLFSPLIVPMAIEAGSADYMRPSFEENVILSADLLAFFIPSELHPLWGSWVQPLYQTFTTTTSERLVFAGFTPLLLAGWAAWRYRGRGLVRFWSLALLCFFILALGPYLHIKGEIIRFNQTPLPLPYLLLYRVVPFIGITRSLSRYAMLVMMALGVLAAVALARVPAWGRFLALSLILIEFVAIPFPLSPLDTPPFFQTIAQDDQTYNIAALPMNWDRPSPLLYQTVHHKGLLTAYTSRQNPLDLSRRTPVFQQWRALADDIIAVDLAAVAPTILHDFNVRYVVLDYYQMPPGAEREGTEYWVAAALPGVDPIYDDGRLKVYPAPPLGQRQPYLQLGVGWGPLQQVAGHPARAVDSRATVRLISRQPFAGQLEIQTLDPSRLQDLTVTVAGEVLPASLNADGRRLVIDLPPDVEVITLQAAQPLLITELRLSEP